MEEKLYVDLQYRVGRCTLEFVVSSELLKVVVVKLAFFIGPAIT
jgi:hypothetical protein